jgi:hypothetical protein
VKVNKFSARIAVHVYVLAVIKTKIAQLLKSTTVNLVHVNAQLTCKDQNLDALNHKSGIMMLVFVNVQLNMIAKMAKFGIQHSANVSVQVTHHNAVMERNDVMKLANVDVLIVNQKEDVISH